MLFAISVYNDYSLRHRTLVWTLKWVEITFFVRLHGKPTDIHFKLASKGIFRMYSIVSYATCTLLVLFYYTNIKPPTQTVSYTNPVVSFVIKFKLAQQ